MAGAISGWEWIRAAALTSQRPLTPSRPRRFFGYWAQANAARRASQSRWRPSCRRQVWQGISHRPNENGGTMAAVPATMGARPPKGSMHGKFEKRLRIWLSPNLATVLFELCVIDFRFDDCSTLSSCFGSLAL